MKQLILSISAFIALSFVACKKEYNCSCKSSTAVEVSSEVIKAKERDDAATDCKAIEEDYKLTLPSAKVTCMLK